MMITPTDTEIEATKRKVGAIFLEQLESMLRGAKMGAFEPSPHHVRLMEGILLEGRIIANVETPCEQRFVSAQVEVIEFLRLLQRKMTDGGLIVTGPLMDAVQDFYQTAIRRCGGS